MSKFTKQAILKAFERLISKKPLDSITVRDIVDECGINRNTFYYYFKDIYDLVDEMLSSEAAVFTDHCESVSEAIDMLERAMITAAENRRSVYHMYNSKNQGAAVPRLYEMVYDALVAPVKKEYHALPAGDAELVASFCAYALTGRMINWLNGGMNEPPEDVIVKMKRVMSIIAHNKDSYK